MRILIHPKHDERLFDRVLGAVDTLALRHSDNWHYNPGDDTTIPHYGYSDDMRSSVVLMREPNSRYYRLTINTDSSDIGYRELLAIVIEYYS